MIPGVEIIIKGDCAFGNGILLNWFDEAGIGYLMGVGGNAVLYKMTEELKEEVLKDYGKEKQPVQRFLSLIYRADGSDVDPEGVEGGGDCEGICPAVCHRIFFCRSSHGTSLVRTSINLSQEINPN